tara:strand:+ start:92 stop:679 length:588 start_codon:yes stop_codon:yes gene_type:complete
MKIFFLGGTFDPPHLGHLGISKVCLNHCDKFIFIPSKQNPFKNSSYFSCLDRVEMLKMMTSKVPNVEIDLFEINSRSRVNYSIDTIKYLKDKYPHDSIHMVLGQDIIGSRYDWKDWPKIKRMVDIVCVSRPGSNSHSLKIEKEPFLFIDSLDLDVSSSLIREKFLSADSEQFLSMQPMLDDDVFKYMVDNKKCQH